MRHQCFRSLVHRTHAYSITVLFPIWVDVYTLFFNINSFFQAIVRCQCFLSSTQRFDLKNTIVATELFLVMVLNFRMISKYKSDFVLAVL